MEVYAFQAKDADLVAFATEMKRRATRRLGEVMEELRAADKLSKGGGDKKSNHRVAKKPSDAPTLADQGIDKNLAHTARTFAAMPKDKFEAETVKAKAVAAAAVMGDKEVVKAAKAANHATG